MIVTRSDLLTGVAVYALTTLPVFLGVTIATTPGLLAHVGPPNDFLHACCNYDGGHFASVVENGYHYDRDNASTIAFFPGYPIVAGWVCALTGWSVRLAMVVIANSTFAAALVLLSSYLRARFPEESSTARLTILALIGLWPSGFFFRMGYSESLFLFALALLLLGFARGWSVWLLAFLAGAATGIRLVGIVATAAAMLNVLSDESRGSSRRRLGIALAVGVIGSWGILAFVGFQQVRFGSPIPFIDAQKHWAFHEPLPNEIPSKVARLAAAEPIWNVYVPGSSRYWERFHATGEPILGIMFWNPILFVVAAVAVAAGCLRGWLPRPEAVIGIGLLLIPYVTRGDELCMGSQARFTAVVVPAFVVMGRALGRLQPIVTILMLAALAPLLMLWSALFAAGWPLC